MDINATFPKTLTYAPLRASLNKLQLDIIGAFHPKPSDDAPAGCQTLLLLGPHEPGFWARFSASTEYLDQAANPLDRWTKRMVGAWATDNNTTALFPSDGPPYPPFISWAKRSGRAWASPIGMLVHDHAGLMVSYRAAISLPIRIDLPQTGNKPCLDCETQACLSICPVNALTHAGYNVPECKSYLNTENGSSCMETGCLARNACPAGHSYGRLAEQSAFHMAAFNPDDLTLNPDPSR